jgi:H+-translocating NAD(P) transhydrogenase subunit beta
MTPLAAVGTDALVAHSLYIVSVVCFMVAIQRMSRVRSALGGNHLAAVAMLLAVVGQLVQVGLASPWTILAGLVVGGGVGALVAFRVKMTQMPEMVALLNGLGGLASLLVGVAMYGLGVRGLEKVPVMADVPEIGGGFNAIMLALTVVVGGVTFTGSVVAFAKLSEKMSGAPILIPRRHLVNFGGLALALVLSALAVWAVPGAFGGWTLLAVVALLSLALGVGLVIPIGGGDMPVVISLLNSYSGVAGALAGFTINEPVLIVAGSLVGASGLILTQIMCKAMNRSMGNVIAGGFGGATGTAGGGGEYRNVKSADAEEAAMVLEDARSCIVVPGYGMAVAQAQHAVKNLAAALEKRGCAVRYAIHPVAGRMPGHMNVLLAEADIPYDRLYEMDAIDDDFKNTDVVIVIGANDVVNPAAKTNKDSPLYGMPVLSVNEARTVFVIKRSLGAGFAGVKNELFELDNTRMIYADAKKACEELTKVVEAA